MPKTIVLSLGGSLIFPKGVDIEFLKNFRKTIEKYVRKGHKFVIICGGGKIARELQQAASKVSKLTDEELDWLGIYATRLNALLIIADPNGKINFQKNIIIAAGWKPGWSTDYDAVLFAKNLGIKEILNMSNVDYVYDKDPKKYKDARKIESISWNDFSKLINQKWKAGMNVPFDPIAAKEAKKLSMSVNIIGKNLKNLGNLLDGKKFKGTIIN